MLLHLFDHTMSLLTFKETFLKWQGSKCNYVTLFTSLCCFLSKFFLQISRSKLGIFDYRDICDKLFKSGPSKFCGKQLLKDLLSSLLSTFSHLIQGIIYCNTGQDKLLDKVLFSRKPISRFLQHCISWGMHKTYKFYRYLLLNGCLILRAERFLLFYISPLHSTQKFPWTFPCLKPF